jgi:hypothetical protein
VKIEQALVLYLLKHKQISLQGIGTFKIDGAIPENNDHDKPVIIPAEAITFVYDPKIKEDNELIDFIVLNTKKIKPLASADLDSFLTLGRQFLNIGKPFTIQNLGTLDKLNSGELVFKPGPVIQKIEVPKPKIEDEGGEKYEENLFHDYQKELPSNNRKVFLIILIIVLLGLGSWAAWRYAFKKETPEPAAASGNIVPVKDTVDLIQKQKSDSLAEAQRIADSISNIQKNPADSFTFKVVVKETTDKEIALARLAKLKRFGRKVIMYTDDSITYKVAQPFMLPLSDTTKILDSLNNYYYLGRAHIETK